MKYIYYISFYLFILILVLLFFYSNSKVNGSFVNEEINPIRDNEIITGMDYTISIDNNMKGNNIVILSSILSGIYHYKDISTIDDFFINLKINNNSYLLKNINIINKSDNSIIRNIDYKYNDKDILFNLEKEDFTTYSFDNYIEIELEKKYL